VIGVERPGAGGVVRHVLSTNFEHIPSPSMAVATAMIAGLILTSRPAVPCALAGEAGMMTA
jgi:hypothetical protein